MAKILNRNVIDVKEKGLLQVEQPFNLWDQSPVRAPGGTSVEHLRILLEWAGNVKVAS